MPQTLFFDFSHFGCTRDNALLLCLAPVQATVPYTHIYTVFQNRQFDSLLTIIAMALYSEILQSTTVSWWQRSISSPSHSALWHQLSGTLCLQLLNVLLPSPPLRHTWRLNCSLLHMTRSNISYLRFELSTYGVNYKCFWHLTYHNVM